jgi:hypothetical protein
MTMGASFCPNCGVSAQPGGHFCASCGQPLATTPAATHPIPPEASPSAEADQAPPRTSARKARRMTSELLFIGMFVLILIVALMIAIVIDGAVIGL